ncbi:MAG: tetratricopeptide repeat protein [Deltaproteobacteria bacterium]|nr:MAG: tetratricopeptide repeat protein [Deltaproteobacteria bacterium]
MGRSLRAIYILAVVALAAAEARAQRMSDKSAPPPAPLVTAPVPQPVPAATGTGGIILPTEKSSDLQQHWNARRDYLRDRDEHRADDEEQRVRQLKDDLAIENLFFISGALVRESQQALAAGAPALAVTRCKHAVEFAPAMAEAHSCLSRALLAENIFSLKSAASESFAAASATMADPRSGHALLANVLGVLFIGLLAAGVTFALVLFIRYAQLYAHDVHHLFPLGARRWQTAMLAAVLILLPLLLQLGPVPLIFTALLACALYTTTLETVIACALLLMLAASPWMAQAIGRVAAFGGSALDVWLVEHGPGSPPEIARLQKRLEFGNDLAVDFALARKAKRDGDFATAEKLYLRALEVPGASSSGLAAVRNNLGNVYLLEGETSKALAQYQQAMDLRESMAAPHFNMSRALNLGGVDTLEKVQAEQARALELGREAVDRFTAGQLQANKKSNKFVMDIALDDALLEPLLEAEERVADGVADEVRSQLAGPLSNEVAFLLPLVAGGLFLLLRAARGRIRPSNRCERCGREVCRRCDAEARPQEQLCAQCVNVFIRRTGVDPAERLRKEYAVHAYHRRRETTARVLGLVSGAGHVMLGYPLRGIVFMLVTASLAASLLLWRGLARDPVAVRQGVSLLRIAASALCLVAVYVFCLRDLLARQRAEGA